MMPQYRLKLLIATVFLILGSNFIIAQNGLASVYRTLQTSQPYLFEVEPDSMPAQNNRNGMVIFPWDRKDSDVKDPYRKNRYSLNLTVAASSILQGVVLSHIFSKKEITGTPPFTFEQNKRTPLGKAFPLLFTGAMSIGTVIKNANKPVPPGLSSMYLYGSMVGVVHGTLLVTALTDENSPGFEQRLALSAGLLSLGGSIWLTHFAKKNQLTPSEISFAISTNFYGGILGASIGGLLNNNEDHFKLISLGLTTGAIGSTFLSKSLMKNRSITRGDIAIMNSATALGLGMGVALNIYSQNRLMTSMGYITCVGSTFAASYFLTKFHKFTTDDAFKISIGTGIGVLTGAGFSLAIQTKTIHNAVFSMVSGAILGYVGSTYLIIKNSFKRDHIIFRDRKKKSQLHYNFNPSGLVLNLRGQDDQLRMMQSGVSMDLVQLQYRF